MYIHAADECDLLVPRLKPSLCAVGSKQDPGVEMARRTQANRAGIICFGGVLFCSDAHQGHIMSATQQAGANLCTRVCKAWP